MCIVGLRVFYVLFFSHLEIAVLIGSLSRPPQALKVKRLNFIELFL